MSVSYRAVDLQIAKAKKKREPVGLVFGDCGPKLISLVIPTAMNCGRWW
jgi:hypothetical protein